MTVLGTGFSGGSTVEWNGSARSTQYVSATELVAQINAADIASTGSASITVLDPQGTGGTTAGSSSTGSNAKTISIVAPSIDATAYQIDPAHDGVMTFSTVSFPSAPAWRVSLGAGTPSNIVIADGKVFLTTATTGGSKLFALSQTNGTTAWGPTAIAGVTAGSASVAYDDGRVFVSGGSAVYAYDAGTGALDWSAGLGADFAGAPTAADGLVYVIATGNATLYALDEGTGAIIWQYALPDSSGAVAVTADGLYVTSTSSGCDTIDLRPATGELIWDSAGGASACPQSAEESPVVANQLVYSPDSPGTSIFAAETGSSSGTLSDSLPAAITGSTAYFAQGVNLDAIDLSNDTVAWAFNGDGTQLTASPIIVNQDVITGSAGGKVYAVDGTSGAKVWTQALGGQVAQLCAGDGLLLAVEETGNDGSGTLTAYTISTNP